MSINVRLNPRNLSNVPASPTYGFKMPIAYIRRISGIDARLQAHLASLSKGAQDTYQKEIRIIWPHRNAPPFDGHLSYTYTGWQLSGGGYSSQAHIAVTNSTWTPWIVKLLGESLAAVYFQGSGRDMIVIDAP